VLLNYFASFLFYHNAAPTVFLNSFTSFLFYHNVAPAYRQASGAIIYNIYYKEPHSGRHYGRTKINTFFQSSFSLPAGRGDMMADFADFFSTIPSYY
jgi:hypothetical protein